MKKIVNSIAFIFILLLILVFFVGLSGGNVEPGIVWVFGILTILFLFAAYGSFAKKTETNPEPIKATQGYKLAKSFYYGILIFGLLFSLTVLVTYFLMRQ
ncbi:MAG: hypothetical protein V4686_02715 [Patescibacteria group bacterium]